MRRRKLRKTPYSAPQNSEQVHDRMATDLPINAQVAPDTVDDPFEAGAKLAVVRSIRDDPLGGMYSRQQIDHYQFAAGRMWQTFHERSEIGNVSAIDPTKEAVDGGGIYQAFSDRQRDALRELSSAGRALGSYDNALIFAVLGERKSLAEIAQNWAMWRERERLYLNNRFRDALHTLAILWKLTNEKNRSCLRQATQLESA